MAFCFILNNSLSKLRWRSYACSYKASNCAFFDEDLPFLGDALLSLFPMFDQFFKRNNDTPFTIKRRLTSKLIAKDI